MTVLLQKGEAIKELLAVLSFGGDTAALIKALFAPVCAYDAVQQLMTDLQNANNSALRSRFQQLIAEPAVGTLFRGLASPPAGMVTGTACVANAIVASVALGNGTTQKITLAENAC